MVKRSIKTLYKDPWTRVSDLEGGSHGPFATTMRKSTSKAWVMSPGSMPVRNCSEASRPSAWSHSATCSLLRVVPLIFLLPRGILKLRPRVVISTG